MFVKKYEPIEKAIYIVNNVEFDSYAAAKEYSLKLFVADMLNEWKKRICGKIICKAIVNKDNHIAIINDENGKEIIYKDFSYFCCSWANYILDQINYLEKEFEKKKQYGDLTFIYNKRTEFEEFVRKYKETH